MKIGIYGGEAFPVYEIHGADMFDQIEVDDITLAKWKLAFDNFSKVQEEIIARLKEHGHSTWWDGDPWEGFHL